jgi:hypothetical protein
LTLQVRTDGTDQGTYIVRASATLNHYTVDLEDYSPDMNVLAIHLPDLPCTINLYLLPGKRGGIQEALLEVTNTTDHATSSFLNLDPTGDSPVTPHLPPAHTSNIIPFPTRATDD